ncbi:MAG: superoxide dismutase family protein [Legionella sp.]|nr:superoxide dismutase family protein [Legionella sp.]
MHKYTLGLSFLLLFSLGANATPSATSITVKIYGTDDKHPEKGDITFHNSPGGLLITSDLHNLPAGPHGFHIHQNKSCGKNGLAAGAHLDPKNTNTHLGPYYEGHLGDLPVLYVNAEGESHSSMLAPRLNLDDIKQRSIMIHAGGDNYTDNPPMGGGGPRIACGIIQ